MNPYYISAIIVGVIAFFLLFLIFTRKITDVWLIRIARVFGIVGVLYAITASLITATNTYQNKNLVNTLTPDVTQTSDVTQTPILPSPTVEVKLQEPNEISIGFIQIPEYTFNDISDRLLGLGFNVTILKSDSDYYKFKDYNVIFLPMGWGFDIQTIEGNYSHYITYIKNGGGLYIEQPNYSGELNFKILPFEVSMNNCPTNSNEFPPTIIDQEHPITTGLDNTDIPGSTDCITTIDTNFNILAKSASLIYPTLLTLEYENGRSIISSTSISINEEEIKYPVSDLYIIQAIQWLAGPKEN